MIIKTHIFVLSLATVLFFVSSTDVNARCADLAKGLGAASPVQNKSRDIVGQDYDKILEQGYMSFAVYSNLAPYSWLDGETPKGIDIDIGKLIAEFIGVKPRYNFFTADENVDADLRNQIWKGHYLKHPISNVMLRVPYSKDFGCRNEMVVLNGQYSNEKLGIAYREVTFPDEPPTSAYFRFNKVGVEIHTLADFYLSNFNHGMLLPNIIHFDSSALAMEGIKDKTVDAVMGSLGQLEYFATDDIKLHSPTLISFSIAEWTIGVAVRHTYRELSYGVDDAINAAVKNGKIEEIFNSYNVNYIPPKW